MQDTMIRTNEAKARDKSQTLIELAKSHADSLIEPEKKALMHAVIAKASYMISRGIFRDRKKHQKTRILELQAILNEAKDESHSKRLQCAIRSKRKVFNKMCKPQNHLRSLNTDFIRAKSNLALAPNALVVFQSICAEATIN